MIWQDVVLMLGGFALAAALLPTVRGRAKPAASTSALTGGILAVYAAIYVTLHLWMAAAATGMIALLWLVVLGQTLRQR